MHFGTCNYASVVGKFIADTYCATLLFHSGELCPNAICYQTKSLYSQFRVPCILYRPCEPNGKLHGPDIFVQSFLATPFNHILLDSTLIPASHQQRIAMCCVNCSKGACGVQCQKEWQAQEGVQEEELLNPEFGTTAARFLGQSKFGKEQEHITCVNVADWTSSS